MILIRSSLFILILFLMKKQVNTEIDNKSIPYNFNTIEHRTTGNFVKNIVTIPEPVGESTGRLYQIKSITQLVTNQDAVALHGIQQNSNVAIHFDFLSINSVATNVLVKENMTEVNRLAWGIPNCSYLDTINITNRYKLLANGSYLYDNHMIIPPNLVGMYDYVILYDGTKHSVTRHLRACICHLKNCITLCSHSILALYSNVSNNVLSGNDTSLMPFFKIPVILSNGSVIEKNIVTDFITFIMEPLCHHAKVRSENIQGSYEWSLFENRTLHRHSDNAYLEKMDYCFDLHETEVGNSTYLSITAFNCARISLNAIFKHNSWTPVISTAFFVVTLTAYSCLRELRNTHGKCVISYLICLTLSYGIVSYMNFTDIYFPRMSCQVLLWAFYVVHYMTLGSYTWLAIICYDFWKSCSIPLYDISYWKYAIFGYTTPLLFTLIMFFTQVFKILDDNWNPYLTGNKCNVDAIYVTEVDFFVHIFGPPLITLPFCVSIFWLTYRFIETNYKISAQYKDKSCESARNRYTLFGRLFLIMGLFRSLNIVCYIALLCRLNALANIIEFIISMHGIYLFVFFISQKRVHQLISQRFFKKI